MLMESPEFLVRSDDGQETMLCECFIDNDTTTSYNTSIRTRHTDHYFREAGKGMRGLRAVQIEPGVFKLEDGRIFREVTDD